MGSLPQKRFSETQINKNDPINKITRQVSLQILIQPLCEASCNKKKKKQEEKLIRAMMQGKAE